jgi:tyrosyl-tRNA synthetase
MFDIDGTVQTLLRGIGDSSGADAIREKVTATAKKGHVLNVKLGLDPTAPDVHLGHAVVLRKIKQLQNLGHRATIIIGDFTGMIGDPTGKSKTRVPLSRDQVTANAKTYKEQIFKIIDKTKTDLRFNSEWLEKLTFRDVIKLSSTTTVARMLERDDFKKRYTNNDAIAIHEFFYPLMQAYDSVAIHADVELGGTDQTFNILMGRNIQRDYGVDPQVAVFMPLLEGTDGVEKMSKSLGNYIGINEDANSMYEKVMKIPDNLIVKYYTLCTDKSPADIQKIADTLADGKTNPRNIKMELATDICLLYHTPADTQNARDHFVSIYQNKLAPRDIEILTVTPTDMTPAGKINLISVLSRTGKFASNGEIKRLFLGNAVKLNGEKQTDPECPPTAPLLLQIGKGTMYQIKC